VVSGQWSEFVNLSDFWPDREKNILADRER
jgi:hypothetical protein